MGELEINVPINLDYVVGALAHNGYDAEEFVISLDETIADEGFTLSIISNLAESLANEYEQSLVHVTGKVLENQFIETTSTWKSEDITNYENALNAMREIIKIAESLSY